MEREASEVALAIEALYGARPLLTEGVIHVSAATRGPDGRLSVLKIGPRSPKSATDFFVLNLCRARCDAILTTAANLRAEPDLAHGLQGSWAKRLEVYRRVVLKKPAPSTCAILTGSGDLPVAHPVWEDGTPKLVLTSESAAPALRWVLGARAEVVGVPRLDARTACTYLRDKRGLKLVSVEAGPSTARALYEAPSVVDELLLSTYLEPLRDEQIGYALPDDGVLLRGRTMVAEQTRKEESGKWRFQRWARVDQMPSLAPPNPLRRK
ncbi:MAG: dihydrofolate reductase family protein [Polyangiales bacterium]